MQIDFRTFLKGVAMGAADVVPGVSGGTIAFISGIYDRLLESIRRINPSLIGRLKQEGVVAAWQHINGTFLLTLLTGIVTSIASLARVISYLLENHPIPVWSFFFGLIVISIVHIGKQVGGAKPANIIAATVGFGFAYLITAANPLALDPTPVNIVLAGMVAICAMILPGISGSFILLLLGLYVPIIGAIKAAEFSIIAMFLAGAVMGLLTFSHVLSFLLTRFRTVTLSFLCGLMIGTLNKVWPWKQTLTTRINSKGVEVPLTEQSLTPWQFIEVTGSDPQIIIAIMCALAGFGLVWGLERFASQD
ncbi:DUF368 domain-containing protein [Ferrimonas lipolytica]|uniref:DUF368 domain-containing protein n=1 Tax=Ferrimonas lipolytica TaxID=2724191 RepID=A0A6H1UDH1_9GAMM|nr:DUF368 domain-containing protein [Ferrimonas lipolytica]QIZ76888.1 DUF368 domain-containing protein [Ferrimonas lipolytica]